MIEKRFTTAFGQASSTVENQDTLLGDKVSERRRKQIDRQEELDDATHEAKMAEARKKTAVSDATTEKSGEKKEESGGFKLTGGMHIDLDAERKEAKIIAERERAEAKTEAERLRREMADTASRTAEDNRLLRNDLHAAEMREIKANNDAAIALIRDKIDGRSPVEIITDIRTMAAELGLKAPDPGISDPALQLQVIQLQNAEAARAREFEWQMQQDRFSREDKKEERADDRAYRAGQLAVQREKNEMFAKAPEVIGMAIGKAMSAGGEGAVASNSSSPKGTMPPITAGAGESGETECIQCHKPVAVGPTAKTAVCAGCGAKYPITRVKAEESSEPEEE